MKTMDVRELVELVLTKCINLFPELPLSLIELYDINPYQKRKYNLIWSGLR